MNPAVSAETRIAPFEAPFTPEVQASLDGMMGRRSERPPLALFRTLLRNFEAGDRIRPLGSYFLVKGTLDPRDRELVIHRVTARCGAEYEWGVHAEIFARAALGMADGWIDATATASAEDSSWDERESLLIRFVDELHDTSNVSDETWAAMTGYWNVEQLLELLMLAGWYHLISFVANGARVPLEPWARRFPAAAGL